MVPHMEQTKEQNALDSTLLITVVTSKGEVVHVIVYNMEREHLPPILIYLFFFLSSLLPLLVSFFFCSFLFLEMGVRMVSSYT